MTEINNNKTRFLRITFFFIILFVFTNNFYFFPKNILSWDVFGYYLYLPLKFIYKDLALVNDSVVFSIIEKYHNTSTFYQGMKLPEGNYVMKYTMGLSFFYFPFFLIGHLIALISSYPADGFSLPYQYSIFATGIVYTIIGLIFLKKILKHFFDEKITAIVLILTVFATNIIIHLTMYGQNANSHNYLFAMYALIIWLTIKWHENYKLKHAVLLAITIGITVLSRPTEIVSLVIPVFWTIKDKDSFLTKIKNLYKYKYQIIIFGAILLMFGAFQFIYWKIQTGHFLYNSYGGNAGEGLDFFSPHTFDFLFSFRKGWYIYTPIMLFSTLGFYFMYKNNKKIFLALFSYFILNIYLLSSWSCWWYAQSFSQRAIIPSYIIMAVALGYFLTWINKKSVSFKYSIYIILFLLLFLNVFQTIQYHKGIIDGDRMTRKYYFSVFGKMNVDKQKLDKLLLVNRNFDGNNSFNENDYTSYIFVIQDFEKDNNADSNFAYNGEKSFRLDSLSRFSPKIEANYSELTNKEHIWIKTTAFVFAKEDFEKNPFSLVTHFTYNELAYSYKTLECKNMKLQPNEWTKVTFYYLSPEVRTTNDKLNIYFWNRGNSTIYVDDIKTEIFERK
ncbi:MAG: glycosyltransferase family 39 protein [Bacteroidales bacterium]|nr:glycosyltransferase family 39 protein [Bacteroidales bacterium]